MGLAALADRAVVSVTGLEGRAFLDRLVTCDVQGVSPGRAAFGALLSPQGKILADFHIQGSGDDAEPVLLLDCAASCAEELVRRLNLYKLRAKLAVAPVPELCVVAGWSGAALPETRAAPDPRHPDLGWRALVPGGAVASEADADVYHAYRIALGVPEAGRDFPFGDAFPHEAMMDQLGGVDFQKGCYVGQEIVSRMQHRGTARTRTVPVRYLDGVRAEPGSEVTAGSRVLGRAGTSAGDRGLATLRLDRAAEALAAGEPILAGGHPVTLEKPAWARFAFPGEAAAGAA